ncbi:MAG: type II toxin-antitoxin system HicB family antitoxin [Lactobacillaceae bacterium]|jgi:predicted RNase H-like HicB family nuclease|nr:type II toxin-antitoxin system HicB family antitoxin [Lactobacillaceae bacterium]
MKYIYYATLYDDNGSVGVSFHDFPSVNTFGEDEFTAILNAQEALEGYLWGAEDEKITIPKATDSKNIVLKTGERLVALQIDTTLVRLQEENKLVKKTLTIPKYLNEAGIAAKVNFSKILTDALADKLAH